MYKEYTYKKQGDGSDSWNCLEWDSEGKKELLNSYMVYFLTVQNWKLKTVLSEMNLLDQVETALNGMDEPTRTAANFAWNFAPVIDSNSNTTKFIQSVLNLSSVEVFDIFLKAKDFNI